MDISHYKDSFLQTVQTLLAVDSPSGFTENVLTEAARIAAQWDYAVRFTQKGGLIIDVPGREHTKRVGLCAHLDTLGLMCTSVTDKGMLRFTRIGGPLLPTLDGEYCRIYTRDGRVYTGTVLSLSPAAHVFEDAASRPRDEQNMAVRIDEPVRNAKDVADLGIETGNYICIDPKTVFTESGFLKSRFLDDKASAACLLTLLHIFKDAKTAPQYDTEIYLTVYEEVGHGGSTISPMLDELLAVDMGCVGAELACTEEQVSICAKDTSGPFDYGMVNRLVSLAKENNLGYAVDVYPKYSSDVAAAWRAGGGMKAALIGPGVHASHGMERTHWLGLQNTMQLLLLYLNCV